MPILIDTRGTARDVPDDLVDGALAAGWRLDTNVDLNARATAAANEAAYGGVGGTAKAGLAAGLRGATLGLSDAALRALGGEDAAIELQGLREENPLVSTIAEIGGAVAPAFFTGGAALPAGAAVRAGRAAGGAAGGIRAAATAGAVEGALFGVGQGVSELSLSTDPLTLERAASALSSNMLFGAVTGGVAGGTAKAVERGLVRAKGALDESFAKRANVKARTPEEAVMAGDLSLLNKRALDAVEKVETERLVAAQAPQRKAVVDELDAYRNSNRDAHDLREVVSGSKDRNITEAGAAFVRTDKNLRLLLDDRVGLAENPMRVKPILRAQEQALEEIGIWSRQQEKLWREAVEEAPGRVRSDILAGKVEGVVPDALTPRGLDYAVERELASRAELEFGGAFENGIKRPAAARLQDRYNSVLDWNRRFQRQLDELTKPHTSELLDRIGEARDALAGPKKPSLGSAALGAAATFGGPLGVVAAGAGRALGTMRAFAGATAERTGKAVSAFLGAASAAAKPAPVLATKVLGAVRYAARRGDEPERETLPELFRRRTDEIKSRTAYDETGTPRLRPEARAEMAEMLRPLAAVDPIAADRLETIATRRIEYLASKIPRRPDFGTPIIGVDNWQPSDMEMRAYARIVSAVEDPDGVEDRAAAGATTPEDVEAYWAVHPERAQHFKEQLLASLSERETALPYDRAAALSMLIGQPMHPSLHPKVISVLQGQFPAEPGTAGGTQSPRPAPQFGAIEKLSDDAKTPAQERMG